VVSAGPEGPVTKKRQGIRQCRRYERYLRKLEVHESGRHDRWAIEAERRSVADEFRALEERLRANGCLVPMFF
jgi:hypothetical protein